MLKNYRITIKIFNFLLTNGLICGIICAPGGKYMKLFELKRKFKIYMFFAVAKVMTALTSLLQGHGSFPQSDI